MRYALFVASILLAFAIPAQGQTISVHPTLTAGNGAGNPVSVRYGASVHYDTGSLLGGLVSVEQDAVGVSASVGPSFTIDRGNNYALDAIVAGTWRQSRFSGGTIAKPVTASKSTGGGMLGLRTGTDPVSVLVGVQHTGSEFWTASRTRFSQTSAVFGIGISF